MLKKIFAALAGALALIVVPPTGEAEQQLPITLDLSASNQNGVGVGDATVGVPIVMVWPLYAM